MTGPVKRSSSFLTATVGVTHPPNPSHPEMATTPTRPSKAPLLHPPTGRLLPAQHIARAPPIPCKVATLDKETPLMGTVILATTTLIQAASGDRTTPLRRVAIIPLLKQIVSHMPSRFLRLAQGKTSMLQFPLHPTTFPLTYIFPWRARNLFAAIDQNGDGALSQDELCMYSLKDPLPSSAQLYYRQCALD
jgi:hypothetical protein